MSVRSKPRKAASPDPDSLRFPDLVRAREAQQEKLRLALLDQNRDLQRRLEETLSPPRSASQQTGMTEESILHMSPDAADATASSAARSTERPTQQAMYGDGHSGNHEANSSSGKLGANAGSNKPSGAAATQPAAAAARAPPATPPPPAAAAAPAAAAGAAAQPHHAPFDVSRLLDEVKRIVADGHKQQHEALERHAAAVDERLTKVERAVEDLHDAVHRDETARGILRDEQLQQHLELCAEMESLRAELSSANQTRREEASEATREIVERLENLVDDCARRVGSLEDLPQQVRTDMGVLEDRFNAMAAGITAERATLADQRAEVLQRQEGQLAEVIREGREQVAHLQQVAADAGQRMADAEATVGERINTSVARVAEQLEAEIMTRLDEQAERVNQTTQRQAMEHHTMQQEIQSSLGEVKNSVESSLMAMRRQYHDAVQEQLRAVVQQAEEFEAQRRAECPVADSDRVELMMQELQGASTMLEGVMQSVASAQRTDPQLPARVDLLEVRLAGMTAALDALRDHMSDSAVGAPLRITVSIPVQTDPVAIGADPAHGGTMRPHASVEEQVAARAERHLAEELERAADEVREASARKALAGGARPSSSVPSPTLSARPPNTSRAAMTADRGSNNNDRSASGGGGGAPRYATASPAAQSLGAASSHQQSQQKLRDLATAELQERVTTKRQVLQRLQGVLRSIQETFVELTVAESDNGHTWPREKLAEVARQKQEMYARERQLVDQRNAVWQSIVELSEELDRRGAASPA